MFGAARRTSLVESKPLSIESAVGSSDKAHLKGFLFTTETTAD